MRQQLNGQEILYPLGVTSTEGRTTFLFETEGKRVKLLLYQKGGEQPRELNFKEEERIGNVWGLTVADEDLAGYEYEFEVDGVPVADRRARGIAGRENWGDFARAGMPVRARIPAGSFDWEKDVPLEIPYSQTVLYRLHVRGFTKHASSKVKERGSFAGAAEKIPYLKELGVTAVELMPVAEFDELMPETGRINYWGYAPSFPYALKEAYASKKAKSPEEEFKTFVKQLHKAGLECLLEFYFTKRETPVDIVNILRYWVQEYHVDGFRLSGQVPARLLAADPFLKRTKLLCENWGDAACGHAFWDYASPGQGTVTVAQKHLAECGSRFQDEMRRFLKGDEGMLHALEFHTRRNPAAQGVINCMAATNGFTMMDMVSYDRKHNETNGEDNRDGSDCNYSWNCGFEGPTRKKKILSLRERQLANAFLLLFLSQGTPMLLAGDEFGNSQKGNNNAYCQDNELSWLNWKLAETNADMHEFVKNLIAFRKKHSVFHMEREPRIMDYKSCGHPDISYHGERTWRPEYENYRRQFGILYWGAYGRKENGDEDDTFYVAYNMHWEPHVFDLPRLPKGQLWHMAYDTSKGFAGAYPEGGEPVLKNQVQSVLPPRSIQVLRSRPGSGYYVYKTPVGEVTVCCEDGAVTGLHFGRQEPKSKNKKEARTELSEQVFKQLEEYFAGTRKTFEIPLNPQGTEFQKKVWKALLKIPYGETRSYKEIAAAIGDEKATRAVGMANNKNPIAILIPCHRVIGADGSLAGYGGGVDIKRRLLETETAYSG